MICPPQKEKIYKGKRVELCLNRYPRSNCCCRVSRVCCNAKSSKNGIRVIFFFLRVFYYLSHLDVVQFTVVVVVAGVIPTSGGMQQYGSVPRCCCYSSNIVSLCILIPAFLLHDNDGPTHTHTHTCRLFASCGNRKLYLYWLRFLSNTHSRHFQMVKGSFFWATHDLNLLFSPFFLVVSSFIFLQIYCR